MVSALKGLSTLDRGIEFDWHDGKKMKFMGLLLWCRFCKTTRRSMDTTMGYRLGRY